MGGRTRGGHLLTPYDYILFIFPKGKEKNGLKISPEKASCTITKMTGEKTSAQKGKYKSYRPLEKEKQEN